MLWFYRHHDNAVTRELRHPVLSSVTRILNNMWCVTHSLQPWMSSSRDLSWPCPWAVTHLQMARYCTECTRLDPCSSFSVPVMTSQAERLVFLHVSGAVWGGSWCYSRRHFPRFSLIRHLFINYYWCMADNSFVVCLYPFGRGLQINK